jgi:hypothetical protein
MSHCWAQKQTLHSPSCINRTFHSPSSLSLFRIPMLHFRHS